MKIYEKIYCSLFESGSGYIYKNDLIENRVTNLTESGIKKIDITDYESYFNKKIITDSHPERYLEVTVNFEDEKENILKSYNFDIVE